MVRFFVGLGFGAILTIYSVGFGGVGHGTYAPLVFTMPLIALTNGGGIIMILLAPLPWALYFLLLPRIRPARNRIACLSVVLSVHILAGGFLAIQDPAFTRAVNDNWRGVLIFGFLTAITMSSLFYFTVRGSVTKQSENLHV
ncbi:MAG: hypothetical protein ABR557_01480 [Pyrinomonadaceae bacterium]